VQIQDGPSYVISNGNESDLPLEVATANRQGGRHIPDERQQYKFVRQQKLSIGAIKLVYFESDAFTQCVRWGHKSLRGEFATAEGKPVSLATVSLAVRKVVARAQTTRKLGVLPGTLK